MHLFHCDYASPSALESTRERSLLSLCADRGRAVRFHGRVKPEAVFLLRTALRAAFEVLWSHDYWDWEKAFESPDPLVSVHPDRLLFEAFSPDRSAHVCVGVERSLFEEEGEVVCGTSNVECTSWLWGALGEMRSTRETWLRLDTLGLETVTTGSGGRFEKRGELAEDWVRGFLQLQSAAAMPGVNFQVKPVDMLALIRFLRYSKPNTSPRAIRYEFEPDRPVTVVAEPWEERFVLRDTEHSYKEPKSTRLWGRKRLSLLEPLLPFAQSLEVQLKGRAMPSFYVARLPGIDFALSITGWGGRQFSSGDDLALLSSEQNLEATHLEKAEKKLQKSFFITASRLAKSVKVKKAVAEALLRELCRQGKAGYFPAYSHYRYRPLFDELPDLLKLFPPNERLTSARALLADGSVSLESAEARETRKTRKLPSPTGPRLVEVIHRDWALQGQVSDQQQVEVVLDQSDRIIFGRCGCPHFRDNLLHRGPCEHLLALRMAFEAERVDPPTSGPAESKEEPA